MSRFLWFTVYNSQQEEEEEWKSDYDAVSSLFMPVAVMRVLCHTVRGSGSGPDGPALPPVARPTLSVNSDAVNSRHDIRLGDISRLR